MRLNEGKIIIQNQWYQKSVQIGSYAKTSGLVTLTTMYYKCNQFLKCFPDGH